jgi:hypothetical protein
MRVLSKQDKSDSITLNDLLTGRLGSSLRLVLEIGNIRVMLPKSPDLWTAQADAGVVWNKKRIPIHGRNGRYVRYRLLLGSFFITESRLKKPLLVKDGKGTVPAGHIVLSRPTAIA